MFHLSAIAQQPETISDRPIYPGTEDPDPWNYAAASCSKAWVLALLCSTSAGELPGMQTALAWDATVTESLYRAHQGSTWVIS